jgi:hypothetical protein
LTGLLAGRMGVAGLIGHKDQGLRPTQGGGGQEDQSGNDCLNDMASRFHKIT